MGKTPIILISGSPEILLEKLVEYLNPCTFLSKPFDKAELLITIKQYPDN